MKLVGEFCEFDDSSMSLADVLGAGLDDYLAIADYLDAGVVVRDGPIGYEFASDEVDPARPFSADAAGVRVRRHLALASKAELLSAPVPRGHPRGVRAVRARAGLPQPRDLGCGEEAVRRAFRAWSRPKGGPFAGRPPGDEASTLTEVGAVLGKAREEYRWRGWTWREPVRVTKTLFGGWVVRTGVGWRDGETLLRFWRRGHLRAPQTMFRVDGGSGEDSR